VASEDSGPPQGAGITSALSGFDWAGLLSYTKTPILRPSSFAWRTEHLLTRGHSRGSVRGASASKCAGRGRAGNLFRGAVLEEWNVVSFPAPRQRLRLNDFSFVNLRVAKSAFNAVVGYDSDCDPARFCLDMLRAGQRISNAPDAVGYHHRPWGPSTLPKQVGSYGKQRGRFAILVSGALSRVLCFMPRPGGVAFIGFSAAGLLSAARAVLLASMLLRYLRLVSLDVCSQATSPRLALVTSFAVFASRVACRAMFLHGLN
jgi:hypothetical protein